MQSKIDIERCRDCGRYVGKLSSWDRAFLGTQCGYPGYSVAEEFAAVRGLPVWARVVAEPCECDLTLSTGRGKVVV